MSVEIIEKDIGYVIEIEENTYVWKMPKVMPKNFCRLSEYAGDNYNHDDNMVVYARYVGFDWEKEFSKSSISKVIDMLFKKWHFFTGIVTTEKIVNNNDIQAKRIEKKKYIKSVHIGPYKDVESTYRQIFEYSKEKNINLDDECLEFYLNDPIEVKESELETIVLIPIK